MRISNKPGNLHKEYPGHIRIEVSKGCTRKCSFCGILTVEKTPNLMTKEVMDKIVDTLPMETKRIDFELGGEPLLNPNLPYFIQKLKTKNSKVQITIISNTDVLVYKHKSAQYIMDCFDAGLNFYHADVYDKSTGTKFIALLKENIHDLKSRYIKVLNFYNMNYNAWSYHGGKNKEIIVCDEHLDNQRSNKSTRKWHNYAGNMTIEEQTKLNIPFETKYKKCVEPFKSLPIDSYGNYFLCCLDFSKSIILGNVLTDSILDVWRSEEMDRIRHTLHNGRRDLIPVCSLCSKRSFRVGLYYYAGKEYDLLESSNIISKKCNLTHHQKTVQKLFKEKNSD